MKAALLLLLAVVIAGSFAPGTAAEPGSKVVLTSEVEWEPLNPTRGDKSPQAGTLWGNRKGAAPTGFLVEFPDGFSSPPHIHNVTYRGIVISGLIHNDDPGAAAMWIPAGSFWSQPKGEVHITAAEGSTNVAYIEIEEGPYLVLPTEKAFDSGERPVNVDASNIVWVDPPRKPSFCRWSKGGLSLGNAATGSVERDSCQTAGRIQRQHKGRCSNLPRGIDSRSAQARAVGSSRLPGTGTRQLFRLTGRSVASRFVWIGSGLYHLRAHRGQLRGYPGVAAQHRGCRFNNAARLVYGSRSFVLTVRGQRSG